jgi:predicted RNase H-like nuclease (RuvC/YqgF family)
VVAVTSPWPSSARRPAERPTAANFAVQRITTENTTLKQRVRTLTAGNRTLEEKLKAARENLRFHDKRIAYLEAQLAPPD